MVEEDDKQEQGTALVLPSDTYPEALARADLESLGLILPVAAPAQLRSVFAEKQRIYAAILDQSDYIYSVSYTENGRSKQQVYARRQDAEKTAAVYKVEIRASPKKSGVVKLAAALGIEARRVDVKGLPNDPNATYSSVIYEAEHKRTGRKEQGVGWCDTKERPRIHDVIATADTRAYNRAVLRLAGFGDVSADEIVSDEVAPGEVVDVTSIPTTLKKPAALPASSEATVLSASRAWAEAVADRPVAAQYAPSAQQISKQARDLRARARRGDESAARELGLQGFTWEGPAQDEAGVETFQVDAPPVKPSDVQRVRTAAVETQKEPTSEKKEPTNEKAGWNLSGGGAKADDKPTSGPRETTRNAASAGVAAPSPQAEAITTAQAKALSEKLLRALGTKEAASSWLKENASAVRSLEVKSNQYESVMRALDEMIAKKGA